MVRPWLNYRGPYGSPYYMTLMRELEALPGGNKYFPFAFVLFDSATQLLPTGTVGAQQTALGKYTQPADCFLTSLVGSSGQAAGFTVQIYDTDRQVLWNDQPINFGNALGSAQHQAYLKRLYRLPANKQLQCQVTNLSTLANAIQVVAWGVRM